MTASYPTYPTRHNRLGQRIEQYLNTLGNWHTYRQVKQPADVLATVVRLTGAFFGLEAEGFSVTGITILGAVMALHALERITAASATLAIRLTLRRPAEGWHRGIALRSSPFTPRTTPALRWLLGGRLQSSVGYYFHQHGCTWHYQVASLRLWGDARTLTHLRSLSLPHRSHFFDRDIGWQTAIDVALGQQLPERLPGHLGSINELEHAAGLPARAKLAYIAASWLLIDPDERTGSGSPSPNVWSPSGGQARYGQVGKGGYPSPGRSPSSPASGPAGSGPWLHSRSPNGAPPPAAGPAELITARYSLNGRRYPLLVRQVVINPITRQRKADAIYYDSAARRWRAVSNEQDRLALAKEVAAGRLKVTPNWQDYL